MISKIIILFVFFILYANVGFAYDSEDVLSNLELNRYGKVYYNDSIAERLSRLETASFGMSQVGDIDSRLSRLYHVSTDSSNPNNFSIIQPNNIVYPKQKHNKIRSIVNNVASLFASGMMTGYTPPFDSYKYQNNMYNPMGQNINTYQSYCPYNNIDNFNRFNSPINDNLNYLPVYSGAGYQNPHYTNHGYSSINKDYMSGSRVHIIRN